MKKVIVAGGRDFNNYVMLRDTLRTLWREIGQFEIVSGMARGADMLAYNLGKTANLTVHEFPAKWDQYGKSAGYKRNTQMAEFSDVLVAFWDGKSKGTKHMIDIAKQMQLDVRVVMYEMPEIVTCL